MDTENRASFAAGETALQSGFDWYTWTFQIDPAIDTVGTAGDGLGLLRFRLYVPEHIQEGEDYPLVATLGGLAAPIPSPTMATLPAAPPLPPTHFRQSTPVMS